MIAPCRWVLPCAVSLLLFTGPALAAELAAPGPQSRYVDERRPIEAYQAPSAELNARDLYLDELERRTLALEDAVERLQTTVGELRAQLTDRVQASRKR